MRKIPLFLTLLLMWAWVYTSWYWYTCNIKWFCENSWVYEASVTKETEIDTSAQNTNTEWQNTWEESSDISEESDRVWETPSSEKLSADDVLSEYIAREESEENAEEESQTGSLLEEEEDNLQNQEDISEEVGELDIVNICSVPLVWPIGLGWENDENEVKRLENFLNSQWENLSIDGVYGQADFEAVNRFQLKYKAQILDPWGITNPTGYVFKTTVKTMNEVACGKIYEKPESEVEKQGDNETDYGSGEVLES